MGKGSELRSGTGIMKKRTLRTLHKAGHRRKFLVVIDESPECESSVYFSACRARNTNSDLLMLFLVKAEEFQHWLRVGEIQREEGEKKASAVFRLYRIKLNSWGFEDLVAEEVVRHGDGPEQITGLINEDQDISFLVLGASTSSEGPGHLISWLAGQASGTFPVPIVLVPQSLSLDEIKALA